MLEVVAEGQAQSLENEVVEITTDFTIGGTVEIDLGGLEGRCEDSGAPLQAVALAGAPQLRARLASPGGAGV